MSELKVDKITPRLGTTLTLGDAGDTINFGSGVLPNFENLTVTGDLTVDTNSLKVDSTNNRVGIGTASPSATLHAQSSTNTLLFIDSTEAISGLAMADTTGSISSEAMRIDSSGNVGVGESSIESKFHVKDNLASTGVGTSSNPIVIIQNERLNTGTSSAVLRFDTNEIAGSQQHPRASIAAELGSQSSNVDGRLLL